MEIGLKEVMAMLGLILGPGGAVWVAAKGSLNGAKIRIERTEKRTEKIEAKLDSIECTLNAKYVDYEHRLTALEAKH